MNQLTKKNLTRSFIFYGFGPVGRGLFGFLSLISFSWIVSPEDFGKHSLYLSAIIIMSIISIAGLNNAFAREYHEQDDKKSLFIHSLLPSLLISAILAVMIFLFRTKISLFLFQGNDSFSIFALSVAVLLSAPHTLSMTALEMEGKASLSSIVLIVWRLLEFLIGLLLLLFWKNSYQALVIAQFSSFTIITIWILALTKKYWITKFSANIHLFKTIFRFSMPIAASRALIILSGYLNIMLIKQWSSIQQVGVYEVAAKIAFIFVIFRSAIERFWIPTQYLFFANGENERSYHKVTDALSSSLLIIFFILIASRDLIGIILGPKFGISSHIFVFILFANANFIFASIISYGINFSRKTYKIIGISSISLVVNFLFLYYLAPSYGAQGAAITLSLASLTYFLGTAYVVRRVWEDIKLLSMIKDCLLMGVLAFLTLWLKSIEVIFTILILAYKFSFLSKSIIGRLK